MKQKFFFLYFISVLFFSNAVNAQNCDPWIQQLYKELYNRSATAEECNIRNYNNGSWNSYDELRNYIKAYNSNKSVTSSCDPWIQQAYQQLYHRAATTEECNTRNYNNGSWDSYDELLGYIKSYNSKKTVSTPVSMPALQGDPWIFQIYKELYNRQPNAWEININNYNGGSWNNYEELKNYVKAFQNSLHRQRLSIKTGPWKQDEIVVGFFINNKQVAVNVVSAGGGNVVSAGGANVVSAGGANVVSAGGANVVSPGGGNIIVNTGMAGVSFGSRYVVQSEGTKLIPTSGKGALIIK